MKPLLLSLLALFINLSPILFGEMNLLYPFCQKSIWLHPCHKYLHLGHLPDSFIQSDLQPFIHIFTRRRRCQPCKATASPSGAVRARCPAHGHLAAQLAGAGGQTINLPVTGQPALPPELLLNQILVFLAFKRWRGALLCPAGFTRTDWEDGA